MGDLVYAYLREQPGDVTAKQVAQHFNVNVNSANRTLGWLVKSGRIKETYDTKRVDSPQGQLNTPIRGSYRYRALGKTERTVKEGRGRSRMPPSDLSVLAR